MSWRDAGGKEGGTGYEVLYDWFCGSEDGEQSSGGDEVCGITGWNEERRGLSSAMGVEIEEARVSVRCGVERAGFIEMRRRFAHLQVGRQPLQGVGLGRQRGELRRESLAESPQVARADWSARLGVEWSLEGHPDSVQAALL